MSSSKLVVTRWPGPETPPKVAVEALLAQEGLSAYHRWSNGPHDVYGTHTHPYDKVIYVLEGSITFILPEQNRRVDLAEGDRLDLPAGVSHGAEVGPRGVTCLEAHR